VPDLITVLAVVLVGLSLVVVFLWRRVSSLSARLSGLTRGEGGRSLEAVLEGHLRRVGEVDGRVRSIDQRTTALESQGRKAVQRVGLVRFNPFEDTGSNQSFALALLDEDGDGVVVSSLHTRQATRVYVRPVSGGIAERALSDEESEALAQATTARGGLRPA
jgi:Protein of unknown function (DUF4446)